jgi:predicted  nucleic acid-binding Zn-ribbon protein
MGYKKVCLNCKKAFSQGTNFEMINDSNCPDCGVKMFQVNQKFKPPRKSDDKQWLVVKFLIENGFGYQSVYQTINDEVTVVPYPVRMSDAKDFVIIYFSQKIS